MSTEEDTRSKRKEAAWTVLDFVLVVAEGIALGLLLKLALQGIPDSYTHELSTVLEGVSNYGKTENTGTAGRSSTCDEGKAR